MITRAEYKKNKRKKRRKKKILIIILMVSLLVLLVSAFNIYKWNNDNQKIKKIEKKINVKVTEEKIKAENINPPEDPKDDYWDYVKMDMLKVNIDELKKINKDAVGFLKVNGTNVNYPIVQGVDNEYYLKHAFDKSKNNAGWIFADYRNNLKDLDKNTIIYGHSRINQTMFGSLLKVQNKSWYQNKENHIIKLNLENQSTLWQIFSIYVIDPENYYLQTKFNEEDYKTFLTKIKKRSQINFNTSVNEKDKILTLSTCSDINGTQRLVIHAKLIKASTN